MADLLQEIAKRRTFAIISHPDAGKTTLTEKLLLFGGAIQLAGSVKARKASRHARSDWMELEKQRGISVTTSVMQFPYHQHIINLLDTPGHEDFSEDTYRTLTAVDSALMVIDAAKGVEPRTIKLLEVCRLRNTPIITFINKMDRDCREPIELLDEIESILKIKCAPMTWPIGMGREFKGVYHLATKAAILYEPGKNDRLQDRTILSDIYSADAAKIFGDLYQKLHDDAELVSIASHAFNQEAFAKGELSPVFFGSAINNFGVQEILDALVTFAPPPLPRETDKGSVNASDGSFSGFVFKIQANMDPAHHDRIAFLRVCSGQYEKGMKVFQVRTEREVPINSALSFMAGEREHVTAAWPGDIIGVHNHGTIQIGDTFTQGKKMQFIGVPNFAPELFRRVRLRDPLKAKALQKGLVQLSEEGATQVFRPLISNDLILGAVGILQFDVVVYRLQHEYNVECSYETVNVVVARWVSSDDKTIFEQFKIKANDNLALDGGGHLTYLAPTHVNLSLAKERWPQVKFSETREH